MYVCKNYYHFPIVPSDSPQNVNAVVLSSMSVMVTWEEVSGISQNGIINQYEVLLESNKVMDMTLNVSRRQSSVNVTELEGSTMYNVSVRAYTSEGPGPYSNSLVQVTTNKDGIAIQLLCSYLNNIFFMQFLFNCQSRLPNHFLY